MFFWYKFFPIIDSYFPIVMTMFSGYKFLPHYWFLFFFRAMAMFSLYKFLPHYWFLFFRAMPLFSRYKFHPDYWFLFSKSDGYVFREQVFPLLLIPIFQERWLCFLGTNFYPIIYSYSEQWLCFLGTSLTSVIDSYFLEQWLCFPGTSFYPIIESYFQSDGYVFRVQVSPRLFIPVF